MAVYPEQELFIAVLSNRIVWCTLGGVVPYEIRLPSSEAREQLAENLAAGDWTRLPGATLPLAVALGLAGGALVWAAAGSTPLVRALRSGVGRQ